MFRFSRYDEGSLHLPTPNLKPGGDGDGDGDGDGPLEEVLLDNCAYIVDERNHTTATSKTRDGREMQATFFLAPPPRVSHFSCVCTEKRDVFGSEPEIIAADGNFALIGLTNGNPEDFGIRSKHDYYVYRASVRDGGRSMLRRLRHPDPGLFLHNQSYYFTDSSVGLLRYRTNRDHITTLRGNNNSDEYDYMVAALCARDGELDEYDLYTYDSMAQDWARASTAMPDIQRLRDHECEKVITVGGDVGTMGWVDPTRGIVLCDLLREETGPRRLRYMTMPEWVRQHNKLGNTSPRFRDVVCVQGRIKVVQLQMDMRRSDSGPFVQTGWTAIQWSRTAEDCSDWCVDVELSASAVTVPPEIGQMLPKPRDDGSQGTVLEKLRIEYPTLSLLPGDDVVCFTAKVNMADRDSWLISVDMKKKTLIGVSQVGTHRVLRTYMYTTISKYLTTAAATKHNMKRPGESLLGFSRKKLPPTSSGYGPQQVEGTGEGVDDMDLG